MHVHVGSCVSWRGQTKTIPCAKGQQSKHAKRNVWVLIVVRCIKELHGGRADACNVQQFRWTRNAGKKGGHGTAALKEHQADKKTGYNPKAHGRAERYVGQIKQRATASLAHANMPLTFWFWASMKAVYMYRAKALETVSPKDEPTFGHCVLIRGPTAEEQMLQISIETTFSKVGTQKQRTVPLSL